MVRFILCGAAYVFALSGTAKAQDQEKLQNLMNSSEICSVLIFDSADIIDLFDPSDLARFALEAIDTNVAWDKNRHKVDDFSSQEGNIRINAKLGCQPSDEGAGVIVIEALGFANADNLRVSDNLSCNGVVSSERTVDQLDCSVSGEIGKRLANQINLNEQMASYVEQSL